MIGTHTLGCEHIKRDQIEGTEIPFGCNVAER